MHSAHLARRAPRMLALSLVATFTLASSACNRGARDARAESTARNVTTVGPENIVVARTERIESGPPVSGSLAAEREATIRAEVGGAVVQTNVEQGQRVAAGTVLGRLDDSAIRDSYLGARSGVTSAQSSYDLAAHEAERAATLSAAGAIADRELEQARRARTAAKAQLDDAKARLASAEKQLGNTQLKAPFDGVVAERKVNAGDVVSLGASLFMVVDPTSMRLEASVPAEQAGLVKVGAPVTFKVSGYAGKVFTGRITRVSPVADPVTRQVKLLVSIPNSGRALVAGLFAEGRVAADAHTGIVVPAAAVDQRGIAPVVVRIRKGVAETTAVAIGLQDSAREVVEITSGVQVGDTLLLGSAQGVTPGSAVRVSAPNDRPAAPASALR
ncbi:MAG: efflux RND transporter periplasmic adaptor subunit [Gemmatimonadaceae bacterium]